MVCCMSTFAAAANDLPAIEKFYEEALGMPTVKYIPPGLKKRA